MGLANALYIAQALPDYSTGRYGKQEWIAPLIAPQVVSPQQEGKYWISDANDERIKVRDTVRAIGSAPNQYTAARPTNASFDCVDHSLEAFVADEERQLVTNPTALEIANVGDAMESIFLRREVDLESAIDTALTAASAVTTPSTKWDATGGANFIDTLKAQQVTMALAGYPGNALVVPMNVAKKISENANFKERYLQTMSPDEARSMGTRGILGNLLDIDPMNIFMPSGVKNVNGTKSFVWGNNVLLFHLGPSSLRSRNLAQHFVWQPDANQPNGFMVERERIAKRKGDAFYTHYYYDQKVTNSAAGHLYKSVLT